MALNITQINEKRETLVTQFNELSDKKKDLEAQIEKINADLHTIRGAVLLCNDILADDSSTEQETIVAEEKEVTKKK